jgi:hypothetical protein
MGSFVYIPFDRHEMTDYNRLLHNFKYNKYNYIITPTFSFLIPIVPSDTDRKRHHTNSWLFLMLAQACNLL